MRWKMKTHMFKTAAGAVYRVTASDIPGPLEVTSFREFMTRYARDPKSVIA